MNVHLQRAQLLFEQSRWAMAEQELRLALGDDPDDAGAHAMLAICLSELERFDEATEEARAAIHLAPDHHFPHYAAAVVAQERDDLDVAFGAIRQALQIESGDPDYHAVLAGLHFTKSEWREALAAAEQGLSLDADHISCTNLRAMALVKLGRKEEAGQTIDAALSRQPDNSVTHANQGWTYLEKRQTQKALEHFQEALRLDPSNEWARQGIVEALKARNFLYAWMLRYFLWMAKLPPKVQIAVLLGAVFGNNLLRGIEKANPTLAPFVGPFRILYLLFLYLTWTADPLFNLLLRLDRIGRNALTPEQTKAANLAGGCLALAVLGVVFAFTIPKLSAAGVTLIALGLLLIIPISSVFKCAEGYPRRLMTAITVLLALLGMAAVIVTGYAPRSDSFRSNAGMGLFSTFLLATFASTWVANGLMMARPRK